MQTQADGGRLKRVFLNMNLPFAPDDFEHPDLSSGMVSANPVLARSVLRPLEQAADGAELEGAIGICDWVLDNIQIPGNVRDELGAARDRRVG